MLSAARNSCCLPLVSVSVYGTGPGFLLLLFSCRSAGQETVNTHSTAPTHKSEQRAALYIQIRDVRGWGWRVGRKKNKSTGRLCGKGGALLGQNLRCPQALGGSPAGQREGSSCYLCRMCQRDMNLKCSPFFHPSLFIYKSLQNAFYYLWGNKIKQEISMAFSPPDLCWSIFFHPHPPPPISFPAPPKLSREQSPLLLLLSSKVLE